MKKISDQIRKEKRSNDEMKTHEESLFHVIFDDDSVRDETDTNWSEFSEMKSVDFLDGEKKMVMLSKYPIKKIRIKHKELSTELDIKEGDFVYQAIKQRTIFLPDNKKIEQRLGRVVGIVRDGKVIEERFLSELTGEILGFRR